MGDAFLKIHQHISLNTYDSWGAVTNTSGSLASTLGRDNPFRYRSYYYDRETGLYYTGSRYYKPSLGRFICPDRTDAFVAAVSGALGVAKFGYLLSTAFDCAVAPSTEGIETALSTLFFSVFSVSTVLEISDAEKHLGGYLAGYIDFGAGTFMDIVVEQEEAAKESNNSATNSFNNPVVYEKKQNGIHQCPFQEKVIRNILFMKRKWDI